MNKIKTKLFLSCFSVMLSLILVVTASVAWLTISTNPEVTGLNVTLFTDRSIVASRTEDGKYDQVISFSDAFWGLAPLKPISTSDLLFWYIPKYTDNGELDGFELSNSATNCNVPIVEYSKLGWVYKTGDDKAEALKNGYYVSTDFYVKTEYEYGCEVRLSVPHVVTDDDRENKYYGTYCMPGYTFYNGQPINTSYGAETCARIGFQIYKKDGNSWRYIDYYILEPNAFSRSDSKPQDLTYIYGSGDLSNYQDGVYFQTLPISQVGNNIVESNMDPERLIVQGAGTWNYYEYYAQYNQNILFVNSNAINSFGKFYSAKEIYQAINLNKSIGSVESSTTNDRPIFTIKDKDALFKITMFVWIEGQDVDCWNDIAGGEFRINVEFAALDRTKDDYDKDVKDGTLNLCNNANGIAV